MFLNFITFTFLNYNLKISLENIIMFILLSSTFTFILTTIITEIKQIKFFILVKNFICFYIFVILLVFYPNFDQKYMDIFNTPNTIFYFDNLSLLSSTMSTFIFLLCYIYILRNLSLSIKPLVLLIQFTELLVLTCFSIRSLLFFYIAFELLSLPTIVLLLLYGSRGRRIWATTLFFTYTFLSSIFPLISIFIIYNYFGTLNMDSFLHNENLVLFNNIYICIFIFTFAWIAFSIKLPTMPLHLWLPEAHVEAPTVGSVILASLLLKLGGFGILRVILPLTHNISLTFRVIPIIFCVISVFYASFLAYKHFDLKKIIAYSSILHMNFSILACLTESKICLIGCIISMLCHSIIAAFPFFMAGFLYEKFKTRNLLYYSSLTNTSDLMYFSFFFVILSNMAIPIAISFPGELALYCGLFLSNFNLFLTMIFMLFFSGLFSPMLVYRIVYFNKPFNIKIISFSIKNNIYISPLTTQNNLLFTNSELFITLSLTSQIFLFFIAPDIFIYHIIEFINLL